MDYTDLNFIFGLLHLFVQFMAVPAAIYALYLLRKIANK
jgi:hypothetical protein